MNTLREVYETKGFNFEHAPEQTNFDVFDVAGGPLMRSQWNLFFDNIPIMGIIFVVNVSEDIERIKEAR